jgi:signal transduction histidine kinase/DNA-binding response OmpR family regulator
MRVLVVEDEHLLADAVAEWLRGDTHAVDVAYDGDAALERIGVHNYDVVVLDRDLPVVHGDDICRTLTNDQSSVRVLMLTAAADIDNRVAGLALGADDYLPKPFAFAELSARVMALGRRSRPAAPPVLHRSGIRLDPQRREVYRDGRYVPLSRKEFSVMAELLRRGHRGLSRAVAGESLGRERGPVHQRGTHHHLQVAAQARRPAGATDRTRSGVPDPVTRRSRFRLTLRARLTLVYGGLVLLAGLALLGATYALLSQQLSDGPKIINGNPPPTDNPPATSPSVSGSSAPAPADLTATFRRSALTALLTQGAIALAGIGIAATASGWLFAGRLLQPLQRMTDTAHRIADAPAAGRGLHERIALDGPPDEIKKLADTFDVMLERLDKSFDSQRRFIANASHELRTPLTLNRALLELALHRDPTSPEVRQLGETLLAINTRHERLIEGLLLLARSEREVTERSYVDLADIVDHVVTRTPAGTVSLHTQAGPAPTTGDPILLERLVQNLVDNGVRHNLPEGGWVRVASATQADGHAVVMVSNTGPLVPRYEIPSLFEPFRRLGAERLSAASPGAGLGLSIVQAVARAHGGAVHAEPHEDGGLVVTVTLPAASTPQREGRQTV